MCDGEGRGVSRGAETYEDQILDGGKEIKLEEDLMARSKELKGGEGDGGAGQLPSRGEYDLKVGHCQARDGGRD